MHGRSPVIDLGELALAVAGHRGDPDDLAGADVERHAAQRRQPTVVLGRHVRDREHAPSPGSNGVLVDQLEDARARPSAGPGRPRGARPRACPAAVTRPRRMTVIRSAIAITSPSLWLMKTTLRPSAVIDRRVREQLVDLLRGEHRRRLVHDQDPGAAVEHLQDLDPLLLADRELPDPARRDRRAARTARASRPISASDARPVAARNRGWSRPSSTFSVTVCDGTSVKCWWTMPMPGRDRVARRAERDRLAVDQDLARVRPVEPGEDVHQRALAGAVLAEQRVDLAAAQVEVDAVVRQHAGEALDDPARLERGHGPRRRRRSCAALAGQASDRRSSRRSLDTWRPAGGARGLRSLRELAAAAATVMPSFHQYMHVLHSVARGAGRELVEVGLLELLRRPGTISLPVLSLIGPAKTSNRPNLPASILASVSLTFWTSAGGRSATPLLRRLALHEAVQAHRLRVGVEVLVAGLVRLGLDLLGDPDVLRTPDPVRRGEAGSLPCRAGWSYVTAHLPFSLATSASAGVSAPVKTTSAPASNSEAAPSFSLTGSCQVLMNRTSIVHSGQVP